jgi:PTS system mannitol-specific IIC component
MNTETEVKKIIVACAAGIGASAMGANLLAKKVKSAGLNISVVNCAISKLPDDVDIVVTHKDLTESAKKEAEQAKHLSLTNFLDSKFYDRLIEELTTTS